MSDTDGHHPPQTPDVPPADDSLDDSGQYLYTYHAGTNVLSPVEERIVNLTARITVSVVVAWVALQELVEEVSRYRSARRQ